MKYDIFISYRREGGYDTAKHLNDLLVRDGYRVSFDIDTLRNGDFDVQLLERIEECKDFILVVDKHAFDRTLDPDFDPQKDWLRCELAHALKHNKNIIPVFLSGVSGFPDGLPADIANVTKKNGPEYNRYHFNSFYEKLKHDFLTSRSSNNRIIMSILGLCLLITPIFLYFHFNQEDSQAESIGENSSALAIQTPSSTPTTKDTFDKDVTEQIAQIQPEDTRIHMTYIGIPLNMSIQLFAQRLEQHGYVLLEKNELKKYYEFTHNNDSIRVYWDEQYNKVFMVEIVYSNFTKEDKGDVYYTFADEYGQVPEAFNEYLDGICFDEGAILFGLDSEDHMVIMYVDKINSNNYRNI